MMEPSRSATYLPATGTLNVNRLDYEEVERLIHEYSVSELVLRDDSVASVICQPSWSRLKALFVEGKSVVRLKDLSLLTELQTLSIERTNIKALELEADIPSISFLDASRSSFTDVGELHHLPNLKSLSIANTPVSEFHYLRSIEHLGFLVASGTGLSYARDIVGPNSRLWFLRLENTPVGDLFELRGAKKLEQLKLDYCPVSSLTGLEELEELLDVSMRGIRLPDWKQLSTLKGLRSLDIAKSSFPDCRLLHDFSELEDVSLKDCPIHTLMPLAALPKLQFVWLSYAQLNRLDVEELRRERPDLVISR